MSLTLLLLYSPFDFLIFNIYHVFPSAYFEFILSSFSSLLRKKDGLVIQDVASAYLEYILSSFSSLLRKKDGLVIQDVASFLIHLYV